MRSSRADITLTDKFGQLGLFVEVKTKRNPTIKWATQLRQNLLTEFLPNIPFFLIATPITLYLWVNASLSDELLSPDYEVSTGDALSAILAENMPDLNTIYEDSFELLLIGWLGILRSTPLEILTLDERLLWIVESGLYDLIKDGEFHRERAFV